jgi:hypothetical protein
MESTDLGAMSSDFSMSSGEGISLSFTTAPFGSSDHSDLHDPEEPRMYSRRGPAPSSRAREDDDDRAQEDAAARLRASARQSAILQSLLGSLFNAGVGPAAFPLFAAFGPSHSEESEDDSAGPASATDPVAARAPSADGSEGQR